LIVKQSSDCFTVQSDAEPQVFFENSLASAIGFSSGMSMELTSYREILTSVFHAGLASASGLSGSTRKHERYRVLHGYMAFPPDTQGFNPRVQDTIQVK